MSNLKSEMLLSNSICRYRFSLLQPPQRSFPHYINRRVPPRPEFELLGCLCNQHGQPANGFASRRAGFSLKARVARIVNQIVSETRAAKLVCESGRFFFTLPARPQRRGIDDQIKALEGCAFNLI